MRVGRLRQRQPRADLHVHPARAAAATDAAVPAALVELTAAPRCDIEREIWLVVHPDVRRSPRVQRVADAIADAVHAADGRL